MLENLSPVRLQIREKMRSKKYRDAFVSAHVACDIAAQIRIHREARGWSQKDLAEKTGMSPSRISVIEDPSYDKLSLSTLKRLASAFDLAVDVRFVPFDNLLAKVTRVESDE